MGEEEYEEYLNATSRMSYYEALEPGSHPLLAQLWGDGDESGSVERTDGCYRVMPAPFES